MVYCPKCGTKNEDTADFCVNCGASLQTGTVSSRRYERRRAQQECFGLPHGGAIAGLVFGAIILIGGLLLLLQETETIVIADASIFGIILIIILGILILAGALYRATHSRTNP